MEEYGSGLTDGLKIVTEYIFLYQTQQTVTEVKIQATIMHHHEA